MYSIYELHQEWKEQLFKLLEYPSYEQQGIIECANYLKQLLLELDMEVRLIDNFGTPCILAKTKGNYNKTILLYSHYDVKPAGDLGLWNSHPFEPTIISGRLYARGSGDAKGQLFAAIKAIEVLKNNNVLNKNVGISLLFEGEEESGSLSLKQICKENTDFLKSDMAIILDSHWLGEQPIVAYGCRGQISLILSVKEKEMSGMLHAGNFGGIYTGAAYKMINALSECYNQNLIHLPDFYEDVEDGDFSPFGPIFTICAIESGYMKRSLIPDECKALVDIRIVCNQNVNKIVDTLTSFFSERGITVNVRQASSPVKIVPKEYQLEMLYDSLEEAFGKKTKILPYIGAYVPFEPLLELDMPIYIVPLAQSDENNHAPNENILIEHIVRGINTIISIYEKVTFYSTKKK